MPQKRKLGEELVRKRGVKGGWGGGDRLCKTTEKGWRMFRRFPGSRDAGEKGGQSWHFKKPEGKGNVPKNKNPGK